MVIPIRDSFEPWRVQRDDAILLQTWRKMIRLWLWRNMNFAWLLAPILRILRAKRWCWATGWECGVCYIFNRSKFFFELCLGVFFLSVWDFKIEEFHVQMDVPLWNKLWERLTCVYWVWSGKTNLVWGWSVGFGSQRRGCCHRVVWIFISAFMQVTESGLKRRRNDVVVLWRRLNDKVWEVMYRKKQTQGKHQGTIQ